MSLADEYKILDGGLSVKPQSFNATAAAAVRAIVCLQELRRAMQDDSLERIEKAEADADHIIKSAGFSL